MNSAASQGSSREIEHAARHRRWNGYEGNLDGEKAAPLNYIPPDWRLRRRPGKPMRRPPLPLFVGGTRLGIEAVGGILVQQLARNVRPELLED